MSYTSKYAQDQMSKVTKGKEPKKKKDKTPKSSLKTKKMTRKEAKQYKKDRQSEGHGSGEMSVRKIKKHGRKASF